MEGRNQGFFSRHQRGKSFFFVFRVVFQASYALGGNTFPTMLAFLPLSSCLRGVSSAGIRIGCDGRRTSWLLAWLAPCPLPPHFHLLTPSFYILPLFVCMGGRATFSAGVDTRNILCLARRREEKRQQM